jgi:hypothetical protein
MTGRTEAQKLASDEEANRKRLRWKLGGES